MTGGINLTASMRSNLLSLQNISRQVSSTQNKLATGNKVNSAIDNPSSYYTARALNNRADDLNALLDSMEQAVSTIKAATTALEAGADFLEQAAAVATQALESAKIPSKSWFEQQEGVAAVVGSWDELKAALDSSKTGNIVIYGNIEAQDTVTLKAGQNLVGVGYYGVSEPDIDKFSQLSFDLEKSGATIGLEAVGDKQIISDISVKVNLHKHKQSIALQVSGNQQIVQNFDLTVDNTGLEAYSPNLIFSTALKVVNDVTLKGSMSINEIKEDPLNSCHTRGIEGKKVDLYGKLNINMVATDSYGIGVDNFTLNDTSILNLVGANRGYSRDGGVINCNDNSKINMDVNTAIVYGTININDTAQVNAKTHRQFATSYLTVPSGINLNSALASLNLLSNSIFDNANENLTFNAVAGSWFCNNGKVYHTDKAVSDNTMTGNNLPAGFVEVADAVADTIPSLDWLVEQNTDRGMGYDYQNSAAQNSGSYASILSQYDNLIKDSSYKGTNLLTDDRLNVRFNETGDASLNISGKDMSAAALGLNITNWQSQADITRSLSEISAALKSIRNFSAELGNNYNIITSRQDFTENLINILTEGADKLTLADMNEESANMLALQTRQQLAVNSLSLASQASQAVLKLF